MTVKAAMIGLLASGLAATPAFSQQVYETEQTNVQVAPVVGGLEHPWGLDFLPDGSAIVTERPGRIRIVSDGNLSEPVAGVPEVFAQGQGGLLDIAAAPDFETTGTIFFTFSEPGEGGAGTALARATLVRDGEAARLDNLEIIFSMNKKTATRQHFGSRIVFNPDGTLFVTTGDRGQGDRSQDMQDHAGAVLRINPDGSVPQDNPSPDGSRHLPEIWSKGHRNIQGAAFDPVTNSLWTVEHGARGGDEVNQPEAGKNYGWPVISYGRDYSGTKIGVGTEAEGYEQPVYYWDPSIAPSGLAVYEGEMFPEWEGDFLVGALAFQLLSRLERDESGAITGEERLFENEFGRIRDVNVAPDGSIWLLTDAADGEILRITPAD
ncbi:PQQ-dependent sugar dehydrogenase [Aquamicrobium sp. LC103]|uniref:PQQ-dependent sugar dehydrogenase n=1 Tax=Aquamicrobium sp. LC103 TaxID=1120658 RepID=UPI00063E7F5B|nr:PQQ-dependent sugar dehydrogenase [Aquamicrobium sp. LC103]